VPLKDHESLVAELKENNARLAESLKRCRAIVAECRGKLAASERAKRSAFDWREGAEAPANDDSETRSSQG
jgi:septal ring factor EnvC (AmiA/AmiB activator)